MGSQADPTGFRIVPELVVADLDRARAVLQDQFGFAAEAGERLRRSNQVIRLRHDPDFAFQGHGPIDHLALSANDVDAAAAWARERSARPDLEVTPHGPVEIPEFWTAGVRYVFFQGPAQARIEFCARRDAVADAGEPLKGHDHVGVCCRDFAASRAFFLGPGLGLEEAFSTTLERPDGQTPVSFLSREGFTVELYCPPGARSGAIHLSERGPWRRLRFEAPEMPARTLTGPDRIVVELCPPS